jgi:glycosyltransferase involved in cell wall biosynthesis
MTAHILVIIPVLRRPHRAAAVVDAFAAATHSHAYRILFVGTPGDDAELDAVRATGCDLLTVGPHADGDYARKINAAYRASSEPWLLCGADDIKPHPGWLEAAMAAAKPATGVIGTNDLGSARVMAGLHSTHPIVRRSYIDEHGTIDGERAVMHEGYPHEYADDELVATAQRRGVWVFARDSVVEHLHPAWGKAETDELYDGQDDRMRRGRALFKRRRRLWM